MKAYVIPVNEACNAKCEFCITNSRDFKHLKEFLSPETLINSLTKLKDFNSIEKIEITGGGEPTLNKNIKQIINICSEFAPTRMYTHAELLYRDYSICDNLDLLCISRAHYGNRLNRKIMGIEYSIKEVANGVNVPIKLSLMLTNGGINSSQQIKNYIDCHNMLGINNFVIRSLAKKPSLVSTAYKQLFDRDFVDIIKLYEQFILENKEYQLSTKNENQFLKYKDITVEFELCDCTNHNNPVIRSDGEIYKSFDSLEKYL